MIIHYCPKWGISVYRSKRQDVKHDNSFLPINPPGTGVSLSPPGQHLRAKQRAKPQLLSPKKLQSSQQCSCPAEECSQPGSDDPGMLGRSWQHPVPAHSSFMDTQHWLPATNQVRLKGQGEGLTKFNICTSKAFFARPCSGAVTSPVLNCLAEGKDHLENKIWFKINSATSQVAPK